MMFGIFSAMTVHADTGAKFSVATNNNSMQTDPKLPYFDLKMQPNTETTLSVNIYNRSGKTAKFTAWVNKATTNNNMVIDYSSREITKSPKLASALNMYKMVEPKSRLVTVPAHGVKRVNFKLKMPKKSFKGRLLGGIYVRKQISKRVKSGFTNRFNFAVAIVIRQSNPRVKPQLNLKKVALNKSILQRSIQATIENTSAAYLTSVQTEAKVYLKKKPQKIILDRKQADRSVASNSTFKFDVPLEKQTLNPGKYVLDLKFVSKNPKRTWHWKTMFTINKRSTVVKTTQQSNWWIWLIVLIVLIIISLYLWWRKRRQYENKH